MDTIFLRQFSAAFVSIKYSSTLLVTALKMQIQAKEVTLNILVISIQKYTDFLIDGRRIGLFRGAKNYDRVAGTWDPIYTPREDFSDQDF